MQRVAIGRALVRDPAIYLMDEPLSSLDAKLRAELRLELKRIQVELGATILYVTHDQVEAMTMASRIGVIRDGATSAARHAARNLRNAGRPLRRQPARHAGDQFSSCRAHPRARAAAGHRDARHPHRAPADRQGERRRALSAGCIAIEHLGDQNHVHLEYRGQTMVTLADPISRSPPGRTSNF